MTNKEAIEILKQTGGVINPRVHPVKNYTASQVYEAVDIAIKVLEAKDRLLKLCEQCEEENGQTRIHINDVRLILAEGGRE